MKTHPMSGVIDNIGRYHIKSGMGQVNDAGRTENQRKTDGQQGIDTAVNQGAYNDTTNISFFSRAGDCHKKSPLLLQDE